MSKYTKDLILGLVMAVVIVFSVSAKADELSPAGQQTIKTAAFNQASISPSVGLRKYLEIVGEFTPGAGLGADVCIDIEDVINSSEFKKEEDKNMMLPLLSMTILGECQATPKKSKELYDNLNNSLPAAHQSHYDETCRNDEIMISTTFEKFSRSLLRARYLALDSNLEKDFDIEFGRAGDFFQVFEGKAYKNFVNHGCLKQTGAADLQTILGMKDLMKSMILEVFFLKTSIEKGGK